MSSHIAISATLPIRSYIPMYYIPRTGTRDVGLDDIWQTRYTYTYIHKLDVSNILFPIPILYRHVFFSFDTVSYNEILSSIVPKVNAKPLHRRTQGGRDPSGETQYVWCFYFNKIIIIIIIMKKNNIFLYVCVFFPPVFPLIIHGKLVSVHARLFFHSWVNQSHGIMSLNRHTYSHTHTHIYTHTHTHTYIHTCR